MLEANMKYCLDRRTTTAKKPYDQSYLSMHVNQSQSRKNLKQKCPTQSV